MRLTTFSDYALRILLYAATAGDRLITIEETAKVYGISRAHLMKVFNALTRTGYLNAVRGLPGAFLLGRCLENIWLGEVIRLAVRERSLEAAHDSFSPNELTLIKARAATGS